MLLIRSLLFIGLLELDLCLASHFRALSHPHRLSLENTAVRKEFEGRSSLSKRSSFTYFATGLGACGETTVDSDYIVAISAQDWDSGAHCFASITITVDGKTASASIVDECMGCASGDLDFSQGLFEYFADTSVGVLSGSWSYSSGSGSSGDTTTTQWQEPTTSSTYVYVAPTTTSTTSTPEWTPTTTSSTSVYTPPPSTSSSTYTPSSSSLFPLPLLHRR
ncbi:RlpA-like double-psi beta-barrel-protein domain-containing protein-containing protein [Mucidula mucida]|nr:RlpA-like double-psi beta-barrel-protein domain-containing protein-containing protein [Mucidula mucida]